MPRREFSKTIKVAVIKRSTRDNVIYCESCGLPAKRFEIDHRRADALLGEPTLENAMLMCSACHLEKTKSDVAIISKAKRQEARHLGAVSAKTKIRSRGFAKKEKKEKLPLPPPRAIFD